MSDTLIHGERLLPPKGPTMQERASFSLIPFLSAAFVMASMNASAVSTSNPSQIRLVLASPQALSNPFVASNEADGESGSVAIYPGETLELEVSLFETGAGTSAPLPEHLLGAVTFHVLPVGAAPPHPESDPKSHASRLRAFLATNALARIPAGSVAAHDGIRAGELALATTHLDVGAMLPSGDYRVLGHLNRPELQGMLSAIDAAAGLITNELFITLKTPTEPEDLRYQLYRRAAFAFRDGNHHAAVLAADQLVALAPNSARGRGLRAEALLALGRTSEAGAEFRAALDLLRTLAPEEAERMPERDDLRAYWQDLASRLP